MERESKFNMSNQKKINAKRRIAKNRVIICKQRGRSGEDASILFSVRS